MTHKKRTQTPEYQLEQALLDAYYDDQWRWTFEPLCQKIRCVEILSGWRNAT
jgi:hypothetical protein